MLDKWSKKEKPVFTGISRGIGGFGFGEKFNDFSRFRRVRVFINLCNDDCD